MILKVGINDLYRGNPILTTYENSIGFYDKEIGKTVFLTQEEAKRKSKEMESE